MKKIATLASAAALAATSLSASAWWGAPYGPCAMTEDQKTALREQQSKAMERMAAAHRQMAEHMTAQQAAIAQRMKEQGTDPMAMGFPGATGPWSAMDPWSDMSMPAFPAMPDMPAFGQFPEPPTMPDMPAFGQMPEPPAMPDMPAFPTSPDMPAFGQMPEPFATGMPQPQTPAFMKDRYAARDAYRARAIDAFKTRRDKAMEEMAARRKEIEANRFNRLGRYAHPGAPNRMASAPPPVTQAPQPAPAHALQAAPGPATTPVAEPPQATAKPVAEPAAAPAAAPVPAANAAPAPAAPDQASAAPQG